MKLILILIIVIAVIAGCKQALKKKKSTESLQTVDLSAYPAALYKVKKNDKWGFMNNKQELVIAAEFAEAEDFSEGFAAVAQIVKQADGQENYKFGFIDTKGKQVVEFKYDKVNSFASGMAMVVKEGKFGFINMVGEEIVPLQYEDASSFSEGLAVVKINGKNGFIDKTGKMVIAPKYSRACWVSNFSEGLAPVYLENDMAGYIDSTGEFVISPEFTFVMGFTEGLAHVQPNGSTKYGFINKKGEMVIPAKYEMSLPFYEGVATVKVLDSNGKTSFDIIDKEGKALASGLPYRFVGIFREGLAGVETRDYLWGFIDKTGKEVIKPRFASVRLFQNGLSKVETGHLFTGLNSGYIDKAGNAVYLRD